MSVRTLSASIIAFAQFACLLLLCLLGQPEIRGNKSNWQWTHGWPFVGIIRWGWRSTPGEVASQTSFWLIDLPSPWQIHAVALAFDLMLMVFIPWQCFRWIHALNGATFRIRTAFSVTAAIGILLTTLPLQRMRLYFEYRDYCLVVVACGMVIAVCQTSDDCSLYARGLAQRLKRAVGSLT